MVTNEFGGLFQYKFGGLLSSTSAVNEGRLNCVQQALISTGLIHLVSLGGSSFVFCCYSLEGNTAMPALPGEIYAG